MRPLNMRRLFLSPPHVSYVERDLLFEAFDSNWIAPLGPMVDGFEKEFAIKTQTPQAAALSSGTAGLHLCLQEVGVKAGDSVLVSSFTFAATANAIAYCGAKPVFLDSDRQSWNMDPEVLEQSLKELDQQGIRPGALLVVDLYGQTADYEPILKLAEQWSVPVIEDAAEALGAFYRGRPAGSFGRAAVFSFNGNKIITTSGGGMVVSADAQLIQRIRYLSTQARQPAPHYEHTEIGYNYRLSNLLAAVGRGQLMGLDAKIAARRRNREFYGRAFADLPGLSFMPVPEWSQPNYWLTCIVVDPKVAGTDREHIRLALEAANIESRPLWKPMHLQPVFKDCRAYTNGVSEALFRDGLCLPSGSALTEEELQRVADVVRAEFGDRRS
jgi:pyridoxal phosphate-dependent aminotransferase EpsN